MRPLPSSGGRIVFTVTVDASTLSIGAAERVTRSVRSPDEVQIAPTAALFCPT